MKKSIIRATMPLKVVQAHWGGYRKPVCDFLLVINNNWHPISYRFGVITAYCSNFGHFCVFNHRLRLRDNVRCSSWAHWKARSGLPISANLTFFDRCYGWGATGKNRSKIGDFAPTRSVWPKISGWRDCPPIIFSRTVRPMNALQLCRWQFLHRETL